MKSMLATKNSFVTSVLAFFVTNLLWTLTDGRELVQIIIDPNNFTFEEGIFNGLFLGSNNWCETCGKSVVNYKKHYRDVHYNTDVQCHVCNKYITSQKFNRHIRDVHGTNNQVECPICNKIFKNDASCKKHLRVLHNVYSSQNDGNLCQSYE